MNINRSIAFLVIAFVAVTVESQTLPLSPAPLKSGWTKLSLPNVGYIYMSPQMEIQSPKVQNSLVTIQQKGMNDRTQTGMDRYFRCMVEVKNGNRGDVPRTSDSSSAFASQFELQQLDASMKNNLKASLARQNIKMLQWYPMSVKKVNGMLCWIMEYDRVMNYKSDDEAVNVKVYSFFNYDQMIKVTVSYRKSEVSIWKSDIQTMIDSFRITNIH